MNRLLTLSLLLLQICLISGNAQKSDFTDNMKMVEAYLASGDIMKALVELEDILLVDPAYLPAQEKKLNILLQEDREKEATRDIEEYIVLYPTRPEYYYLRALLNMQKQKYSRAIQDFDRAIQLEMPADKIFKVYLNRGISYYKNADFELAEGDFDEVISLDPRNAAAYHGKGMVKYELGLYNDATVEFQRSLDYDPKNPITHFNMAMSYFRLNESDKACYHFNESCALGHRNACRLLLMECDINVPQ